jgi:hypothetical protein
LLISSLHRLHMHVEFYSNLLIRKPAHLLGQFVYVWSFYAVSFGVFYNSGFSMWSRQLCAA